MKKELPKLEVNSFDELFSTEEQRIDAQLEKVSKIPLSAIRDFADHPFHVRMDEDMVKLIDSVQENGVLVPVLVRPHKDGNGFEMIAVIEENMQWNKLVSIPLMQLFVT